VQSHAPIIRAIVRLNKPFTDGAWPAFSVSSRAAGSAARVARRAPTRHPGSPPSR
jgi:hypothetical protein